MTGTKDPMREEARTMMVVDPRGQQTRIGLQPGGGRRFLLYALGLMCLGCLVFSLPNLCQQVVIQMIPERGQAERGVKEYNLVQLPPEPRPVPQGLLPPPRMKELQLPAQERRSGRDREPYQPCGPRPTVEMKVTVKEKGQPSQKTRGAGNKGGQRVPPIQSPETSSTLGRKESQNPSHRVLVRGPRQKESPLTRPEISIAPVSGNGGQSSSQLEMTYGSQEKNSKGYSPVSVEDTWSNSMTPEPLAPTMCWKNSLQTYTSLEQAMELKKRQSSSLWGDSTGRPNQVPLGKNGGQSPSTSTAFQELTGENSSPPPMMTMMSRLSIGAQPEDSDSEESSEGLYIDYESSGTHTGVTTNTPGGPQVRASSMQEQHDNGQEQEELEIMPNVPAKMEGKEGQSISVPCIYPAGSTEVLWSRYVPDQRLERESSFMTITIINLTTAKKEEYLLINSKTEMIIDKTQSKVTLILLELEKKDAGQYYCLVRGTDVIVEPKTKETKGLQDRRQGHIKRRPRSLEEKESNIRLGKTLEGWLESNSWLRWATYTAKSIYPKGNCYICAKQVPRPLIIPLPGNLSAEMEMEKRRGTVSYRRCVLELGNPGRGEAVGRAAKVSPHIARIWQLLVQKREACERTFPDLRATENEHIVEYEIDGSAEYECIIGEKSPFYKGQSAEGRPLGESRNWVEVGEFMGPCRSTWRRIEKKMLFPEKCCEGAWKETGDWRCNINNDEHCTIAYQAAFQGFIEQEIPLEGVYWICGKQYGLQKTLPKDWAGKCAWVRVVQATHILPFSQEENTTTLPPGVKIREPRDTSKHRLAPGFSQDVPKEFLAMDHTLAGFLGALPFFGSGYKISENTKWINYIYYNQMRFLNYTMEALNALNDRVEALAVRLDANTQMTLENRMVLDWMLAKEGGVCAVVGDTCCTYIPEDSTSDGAFLEAMDRLRRLRDETHDNAGKGPSLDGIDTSSIRSFFTSAWDWMKGTFGSLGATVVGWILKLLLGVGILVAIICCFVTCCGKICSRPITKVVEKQLVVLGPVSEVVGPPSGIYEVMDNKSSVYNLVSTVSGTDDDQYHVYQYPV